MIKYPQRSINVFKVESLYLSRIIVVQAIYSFFILKEKKSIRQVCYEYIKFYSSRYVNKINLTFCYTLIHIVINNISGIDNKIKSKLSREWKLHRLPEVVLSILRVGIAEILYNKGIIIAIIINDYLIITKSLNHYDELSFINSVLDKVAKNEKILKT